MRGFLELASWEQIILSSSLHMKTGVDGRRASIRCVFYLHLYKPGTLINRFYDKEVVPYTHVRARAHTNIPQAQTSFTKKYISMSKNLTPACTSSVSLFHPSSIMITTCMEQLDLRLCFKNNSNKNTITLEKKTAEKC